VVTQSPANELCLQKEVMISFNIFFLAAVLDDLEWFLTIRTLLMAPFRLFTKSIQSKQSICRLD
jgi:hypothetical protein